MRPISVSAKRFYDAFERAMGPHNPYGAFVSHYSVAELRDMLARYLSTTGLAGIAVRDHGDGRIEGTALFNAGDRGMGDVMLKYVVKHDGVNYLECFGEGLVKLYERNGFVVQTASPFNDAYAPPDWDYEQFDRPYYYTMRREPMEFTRPKTQEEYEAAGREMLADPAEVRRSLIRALKADNPNITDKELDTELALVEATFGF